MCLSEELRRPLPELFEYLLRASYIIGVWCQDIIDQEDDELQLAVSDLLDEQMRIICLFDSRRVKQLNGDL